MLHINKILSLRDLALAHLPKIRELRDSNALVGGRIAAEHTLNGAHQTISWDPLATGIERQAAELMMFTYLHPETSSEKLYCWDPVEDAAQIEEARLSLEAARELQPKIETGMLEAARLLCELSGTPLPPWITPATQPAPAVWPVNPATSPPKVQQTVIDALIINIFRDAARRFFWGIPELGRQWEDDDFAASFITDKLREIWRRGIQDGDENVGIYRACERAVWDEGRQAQAQPMEPLPQSYYATTTAHGVEPAAMPALPAELPVSKPRAAPASGRATPAAEVQILRQQETKIMECLKNKGYDAQALPKAKNGFAGVKAEIREELNGRAPFEGITTFDKAWVRLRGGKEIREEVTE